MFNLFNRNKKTYPKLKFGFRGENIEYATEIDSVEIGFTYIQGKRLYLDFTHWKSKRVISNHEKETILNKCLRHCNKNSFQKTIVVINSDVDKEFWLSICSKYKSEIKDIEFTSNDSQKKLLLESKPPSNPVSTSVSNFAAGDQ